MSDVDTKSIAKAKRVRLKAAKSPPIEENVFNKLGGPSIGDYSGALEPSPHHVIKKSLHGIYNRTHSQSFGFASNSIRKSTKNLNFLENQKEGENSILESKGSK